ncbi:MAG: helix-turn-helix domain-containing protein [Sphingobacterium sp.]
MNYHKYLHVSELDKQWGLYINTIGHCKVSPHQSYPLTKEHPKTHSFNWDNGRILDDYYIVFISKGGGTFQSAATQPVEVNEGICFFLYPGIWHRYRPNANSGWEEYWIGFNGTYPDQLMNSAFFEVERPFINVGLNFDILGLFHNLIEKVQQSSPGYRQVITGIALQMLGILHGTSMSKEQEDDPILQRINKAKFLLQESLERPIDMETLAEKLPMGYSSFRKYFKQATGVSPNQYHLDLRLKKAVNLLASSTLNVSEVADQTGFDSLYYFSRLFKKKTGKSPSQYRQELSSSTGHSDPSANLSYNN